MCSTHCDVALYMVRGCCYSYRDNMNNEKKWVCYSGGCIVKRVCYRRGTVP